MWTYWRTWLRSQGPFEGAFEKGACKGYSEAEPEGFEEPAVTMYQEQ